jgi:cyclopropane fatty-acyl-phospholipid synthase-like methyltransferase
MDKPFSQACENNKEPILEVLNQYLVGKEYILEIGSGTGQHARYFADNLPNIVWQTSDVQENHLGIEAWIRNSQYNNILSPLPLNVNHTHFWPTDSFDTIFTANTMHIMSWPEVQLMFKLIAACLNDNGTFFSYGPYNQNGDFTSPSNKEFDSYLRSRNPNMGLRDLGDVEDAANQNQIALKHVHAMPANNMLLVFQML